jgi:hypothetical protein
MKKIDQIGGGWELLRPTPGDKLVVAELGQLEREAEGEIVGERKGLRYVHRAATGQCIGVLYHRRPRFGHFYAGDDHVN